MIKISRIQIEIKKSGRLHARKADCDLSGYQVGKKYSDRSGILETGTMIIEALIAKLAWILGQTRERAEIEALFYQTINCDRY